MSWITWLCCSMVMIAGCVSHDSKKVFLENTPLDVPQKPSVLFPDYFLMDGFELHDHGHIPNTRLIGAGMSADLDLATVRGRFNDVLYLHEWNTDALEIGRQSFRIIASHNGASVEVRGVQGTSGPTRIFLLYTPGQN